MHSLDFTKYQQEIDTYDIDFFFCSASFEKRCEVVPLLSKPRTLKAAFIFFNDNEFPEIVTNANKIKEEFAELGHLIRLNTDYPVTNFIEVDKIVDSLPSEKSSNILIDATTFTHETLLVLIRILSFRKEKVKNIYIAYVGAKEYSINEPLDENKWLSKGIKDIRTVIGYSGFTDPTKKNHLLIMFGFESERTKKIIEAYEYEYISLGFALVDESIQTNHHKINCERHEKLLEEYPHAGKFTFSLIDCQNAKANLLSYIGQPQFEDLNTVIAPLNNKISTIGAGLAAIANENIQIAYARPNFYNINGYSVPNETIYCGKINL